MEALIQLEKSLESAQTELAGAEIGLAEATARANAAREGSDRLKAAISALKGESTALNGESPTATVLEVPKFTESVNIEAPTTVKPVLSKEEYDVQRKKKQRAREKELQAQNPYGHVKCPGCGVVGKLNETIIQAPSGVPLKMLICAGCNNQIMV